MSDRHNDSKEMKKQIEEIRQKSSYFLGKEEKLSKNVTLYVNNVFSRKWIFIIHGLGSNAYKMSPYTEFFLKSGFNTITIDNTRSYFSFIRNCEDDIKSCIDYTVLKYSINEYYVFGMSLGASASINVLSTYKKETNNKLKCKQLILDCPFDNFIKCVNNTTNNHIILKPFKGLFLRILKKWPINVIDNVKELTIPILYLYGDQDKLVLPEQTLNLIKASENAKSFVSKGAAHSRAMFYNQKDYYNFISKNLI